MIVREIVVRGKVFQGNIKRKEGATEIRDEGEDRVLFDKRPRRAAPGSVFVEQAAQAGVGRGGGIVAP
jgi:hypothetical protein